MSPVMKIIRFYILLNYWSILESYCYVTSRFDMSSLSNNFVSDSRSQRIREKRYLVYPNGAPARSQFIIGLGIPTESGEQSINIGIAIKFEYDLPLNSTQYTDRIFDYAPIVSSRRYKVENIEADVVKYDNTEESKQSKILPDEENDNIVYITAVPDDNLEATKYDIINVELDNTFNDSLNYNLEDNTHSAQVKRSIFESQNMYNKSNLKDMGLQKAIEEQEKRDAIKGDEEVSKRKTNRWDLYKFIEHLAARYGVGGRACMLRTVCEAAETPFTYQNGLLGEIIHILFTPSSTLDPVSMHADHEYHAAERLGRESGGDCARLFPECESSMLDAFTQVGLDTMHHFNSY